MLIEKLNAAKNGNEILDIISSAKHTIEQNRENIKDSTENALALFYLNKIVANKNMDFKFIAEDKILKSLETTDKILKELKMQEDTEKIQSKDLGEATLLLKQITDFEYYRGMETKKGYEVEINTKSKIRYHMDINLETGRLRIFKNDIRDTLKDNELIHENKISSARTGTIDFSKAFAEMTKDEEDYDITVSVLEKSFSNKRTILPDLKTGSKPTPTEAFLTQKKAEGYKFDENDEIIQRPEDLQNQQTTQGYK